MRKFIYILFFVSSSIVSSAQNTWVQKLSYSGTMTGYYDTLTGVRRIETGKDGSIYLVAHIDQHYNQYLYKINASTRNFEWQEDVGYHGMMGTDWSEGFTPTSDSGIIICSNSLDGTNGTIYGSVRKFSKSGVLQWTRPFGDIYQDNTVHDVIEKSSGGYYVLVDDSIYTLDNSGNGVDSMGLIAGKRFLQMSNGDLLVMDGILIYRTDTSGNVIWSQPCTGQFAYDTANVFIQYAYSSVKKVDALTGNLVWARSYGFGPISEMEATYDGGVIVSIGYRTEGLVGTGGVPTPGVLFRTDSVGDTLWMRMFPFPHYGLSTFRTMASGNILTGGCYISANGDHSAFICMMDSAATYPLQQTSYVCPPDADHDQVRNFTNDALAAMLALGKTGVPRDSSWDGYGAYGFYACGILDIAIDWATSSAGVNHKYSDFDGNGVVDTNDLNDLGFNSWCEDSVILNYRLGNPNDVTQSTNEFCIQPVNDTIQPGEDPVFYLILGSSANPIDSIYGFALSYFITGDDMEYVDSARFYSTGLGTPGVDARSFQNVGYIIDSQVKRQHTMVCRTDFQNAYNVSDTIGVIHFRSNSYLSTITPTIADFKAILADGTPIPFSVCTGSIFIDSSSVAVRENERSSVKTFPNPASHSLNVETGSTLMKKIVLMNSLGEKLKMFQTSLNATEISVEDLPDGFYTGTIVSENNVRNFSFVVQH